MQVIAYFVFRRQRIYHVPHVVIFTVGIALFNTALSNYSAQLADQKSFKIK